MAAARRRRRALAPAGLYPQWYPAEIQNMKEFEGVAGRRLAPRYPADFPARISVAGGDHVVGRLVDLSPRGAALAAPREVAAESGCLLEIADPEAAWRLAVPASVVRVEPDPFGGFLYRLRFHPDAQTAQALAKVVGQLRRRFNARQANIAAERLGPYGPHPPNRPAG